MISEGYKVTRYRRPSASVRRKRRQQYRKRRAKLKRYAKRYRKRSSTKRRMKRLRSVRKRMHLRPGRRLRLAGIGREGNIMEISESLQSEMNQGQKEMKEDTVGSIVQESFADPIEFDKIADESNLSKFENFLKDHKLEDQVTKEEKDDKVVYHLKPDVVKDLDHSYKVFTDGDAYSEYVDEIEAMVKDLIRKSFGKSIKKIDVKLVGDSNYAYIKLSINDNQSADVSDLSYQNYSSRAMEAADGHAKGHNDWDWAAWFADERSPLFDQEWVSSYDDTDMALWFREIISYGDSNEKIIAAAKESMEMEESVSEEIKQIQESINEFKTFIDEKSQNHLADAFKSSARVAAKLTEAYEKIEKPNVVVEEVKEVNEFDIELPDFVLDHKTEMLSESFEEVLGIKRVVTEEAAPNKKDNTVEQVIADLKQIKEHSEKLSKHAEKNLLDEVEAKDFLKKAREYMTQAMGMISEDVSESADVVSQKEFEGGFSINMIVNGKHIHAEMKPSGWVWALLAHDDKMPVYGKSWEEKTLAPREARKDIESFKDFVEGLAKNLIKRGKADKSNFTNRDEDAQSGQVFKKDNKFMVKNQKTGGYYEIHDQNKARDLEGAMIDFEVGSDGKAQMKEDKKKKSIDQEDMKKLAEKTGLTFDGGDDNRLFPSGMFSVDVSKMSKKEYAEMEKAINSAEAKGEGFEVYAWNDVSGYEYWKSQGESGDFNYIMVTAAILDPKKADPKKLMSAMHKVADELEKFDNVNDHGINIFESSFGKNKKHIFSKKMYESIVDEAKLEADKIKEAVDNIGKIVAESELSEEDKKIADAQLTIILKVVESHEESEDKGYLNAGVIKVCAEQIEEVVRKGSKDLIEKVDEELDKIVAAIAAHEALMKEMGVEEKPEEPEEEPKDEPKEEPKEEQPEKEESKSGKINVNKQEVVL